MQKQATIEGIFGHPMSGLWLVQFDNGEVVPLSSGFGARQLAACFGPNLGVGHEVMYTTDAMGILESFIPVEVMN